jgi:alkanesulfonate monooxygenase SsuD/methylene tetrahydromethanopterin reductase-like flavin-dependent oxidoreductase (luciferase family)
MKFGIFYEHQLPRPWNEGDEQRLFQEALDQVELADSIGFDVVWEVEHHFLEEYSHSSAPEVFLAACSQRTKRIRLGHGIVQMPPPYNHPARVAERIATLDLVSNGRVEWGTGESSAALELGGFKIPESEKHAMYLEATAQAANMIAMTPYPGFEGRYVKMPCRNIVPKPVQKPHPPLWVACSRRETIHRAARMGVGALTFTFVDPSEAKRWVDEYYDILKKECVPIGHAVNPNVAMVTGFSCHPDQREAEARGLDGFRFFNYALAHLYIFGEHKPGFTDIWERYERAKATLPPQPKVCIGTPDHIREQLRTFAASGVDQVVFIQQGGRNRHEHICQALELFAKDVMPEFQAGEAEREARKRDELGPFIEAAMARKQWMAPLSEEETEPVLALGRQIVAMPPPEEMAAALELSKATGVPFIDTAGPTKKA